ncbi:MAG: rRNA maturation RNase YbeY, partial [Rhodobacteraceae bacterium]|nr:rRNA maturation RNase YbeY [Paracoccaceae bacterium]
IRDRSYDTCAREAVEGKIPFDHHLSHLLIHSCLHLLGFDHKTDADAARMQGIETKLLASMGISDPY